MILLADESVDQPIVDRLRKDGHDTISIAELSPSISDDEVLTLANSRDAVLITADKDFGELVHRLGRIHIGVILVRLAGLSNDAKADAVAQVLRERVTELAGAFCVIAPGLVRVRRSLDSETST